MGNSSNTDPTHGLKEDKDFSEHYEEESFKSPLVLSFDEKYVFNSKEEGENLEKMKNYGKIPVFVIHEILLFNQPIELINIFCTCKLFYEVSSTSRFWKLYYQNYYKVEELEEEGKELSETPDLNWKKQFFKRFRANELAEHQFLRDFKINTDYKRQNGNFDNITFTMIGDPGVGKRSFIHKFFRGKFTNEEIIKRGYFQILDDKYEYDDFEFRLQIKDENYLKSENNDDEDYEDYRFGQLLCFDVCKLSSFLSLKKYLKLIIKNRTDSMTKKLAKRKKHHYNIVVVGMKCDEAVENRKVERNDVIRFVRKNSLKGYTETSSRNECNIYLPIFILSKRSESDSEDVFEEKIPVPKGREVRLK